MSDIYKQRSYWKIILAIAGFFILMVTLIYSNYLASKLAENEEKNAFLFKEALEFITTNENYNEGIGLQDTIVRSFPLPVIFKMEDGFLEGWNFADTSITDQIFLQAKVDEFINSGFEPLHSTGYTKEIYYFNSRLLVFIKYYPFVQILLVGSYIGLGYFLFNASRKSEQNRVWAGMAKETAHQLGTPISAMIAWLEFMKESNAENPEQLDVVLELEKDVERLELVADRFSKIGSAPKLEKQSLAIILDRVFNYMKRRAPRKVSFNHTSVLKGGDDVMINSHLFEWVIENMLRNSLDAMEDNGIIEANIYEEPNYICLDITDSGKGIPQNKFKTVFQPGYSTKNRGWGLGLSLAKRIIEQYHKGKIFVKSSRINIGTTFTIKLPNKPTRN
jgi:signal transduction histidine kinase